MNQERQSGTSESGEDCDEAGGFRCPMCRHGICQVNAVAAPSGMETIRHIVAQSLNEAQPRRLLGIEAGIVPIICSGWAASIYVLPDGRRQISSFWVPGDIVWPAFFCADNSRIKVQAITPVRYRTYERVRLVDYLFDARSAFEAVLTAFAEERCRVERLIVDLGLGSGEERVARLILDLAERSGMPPLLNGQPFRMHFPLRQHHIADATGLTQAHVAKIISKFRKAHGIELQERTLTIYDPKFIRRYRNLDL